MALFLFATDMAASRASAQGLWMRPVRRWLSSPRLRVFQAVLVREVGAQFRSLWFYVTASAICMLAAIFGAVFLQSFATESVLVSADPLAPLNAAVIASVAVVVGLRLSTSLSFEREHRTLEVLLSGPVDMATLALAKLAAEIAYLGACLSVYVVYLGLASPLGEGAVNRLALNGLAFMALLALPVLASGLLASSGSGSVRQAVLRFLMATGILGCFELAFWWLRVVPVQDMTLPQLYLRYGMSKVDAVLHWISPVAYLGDSFRHAFGFGLLLPGRGLAAAGLTLALIVISILIAKRRGAQ